MERVLSRLSDPERDLKTESGLVYDLASVSKVVGVGTVSPSCGSSAN